MKKRIISLCFLFLLMFTVITPSSIKVKASSTVIEKAIAWAIATANDNSHGYSQSNRWGPDYDCSSFVISAFKSANVNTGSASYTGNMRSQFTQHGFKWIPWSQIGSSSNLKRGDVLLAEHSHTEIYLGNKQNVGAHSNRGYPQTGDQTGTEVSVSGYYYHPWDGVLRYMGGDSCHCSSSYAGNYTCTSKSTLNIRSGHGTEFSVIGSIPSGATVYVSKADGTWAHVTYKGISGYASMQYLSKQQENVKIRLHTWVSDSKMGDTPSTYIKGTMYYLCYELLDDSTGKRLSQDHGNLKYTVKEVITKPDGSTAHSYQYTNSDNNWIGHTVGQTGTYKGTVTVTGDFEVSSSVSWNVTYGGGATLSASTSSVTLNIPQNSQKTITLTAGGTLPDQCQLSKSVSGTGFTASWEGDWYGNNSHDLKITATGEGSGKLIISLKDASTGATVTTVTINVTVTAAKYTIRYNANGGSGAPNSQTKTANSTLKLSTTVPTRNCYEFRGWSTSSSASYAQYLPGAYFTTNANTTLYAVWASPKTLTGPSTISVNVDIPDAGRLYKFIPPVSGCYRFESTGTKDTYITLCNAVGSTLAKNDDSGADRNFLLDYYLIKGNTYYIEASMYNSSATGAYTMTITRQLSDMTGVKIGGRAGDALRLNWNKNSGASGYIIEQYKAGKWVRIARIASNATTSYRVEGLSPSTAYQFRIQAFGFNGNTAIYSGYTYINGKTNPSTMTGVKIAGWAKDALRINWNKNTTASGYIIYQYKSGQWVRIAKITNNATTTYRVENLAPSTTYQFRIQAYGFDGNTPLYGNSVSVSGKTLSSVLPSAVSGLKIGGRASDALRLNWNKSSNAGGYIIEQYKNGAWSRIARIGSGSTLTYRVEKLSASTTYQFRVKSFAINGSTAVYSGYTYIKGKTNPSAMTGVKIAGRANDALRINWNKNNTASGYIISQYKSGQWVRIAKITNNATTTYRVENLQPGTSYVFRTQAFGFDGNTPLYSTYQYVSGTTY